MSTRWVLICVLTGVTALHAYKAAKRSTISGKVSPANGVSSVWAIHGSDSLKLVPTNGNFVIEAKPGIYDILFEVKDPFQDIMLENVDVITGRTVDIGEIRLSPY